MSSKISPYSLVQTLTNKEKKWSDFNNNEKKLYTPYMSNRFLSMDKDLIITVNELQKLELNSEQHYKVYYDILPKFKYFKKYIKSKHKKSDGVHKIINMLKHIFECSYSEAINYFNRIKNKDLYKRMFFAFGLDDKEIKKLLKELN